MSLPEYPHFKTISVEDKPVIEEYTLKFPPYCDFNFSNIYCWSAEKNPTAFSILNDNLVIKMKDFTNEHEVVSFLGINNVCATVKTLLASYPVLSMVPESSITEELLNSTEFVVQEDINNHDYIIELEDIINLKGNGYKSKRAHIKKFLRLYPEHEAKLINIQDPQIQTEIGRIFFEWAKHKGITDTSDEISSITRLMKTAHLYNLRVLGLYINGKLAGFTTNELLQDRIAIGSFGKGMYLYDGIFPYLEHLTAKYLHSIGYQYLNYEQDLGIEGLRMSKMSWRPKKLFKKYLIQARSNADKS